MPLAVGSKAPDFTLKTKTAEGLKDIKLSDNFGKKQTVLLFYPLAFTGTCTQEMCDMTSGLDQYTGLGAEVYGISVDSPFANEAWAKQNKIGLTLLSDLNKTVTKAYDVVFPGLAGIGDTWPARPSSSGRTVWSSTPSRPPRRRICPILPR